jgi:hypothetical protein
MTWARSGGVADEARDALMRIGEGSGAWLNNDVALRLQVDDNPKPIVELRRLVERAASQRRR